MTCNSYLIWDILVIIYSFIGTLFIIFLLFVNFIRLFFLLGALFWVNCFSIEFFWVYHIKSWCMWIYWEIHGYPEHLQEFHLELTSRDPDLMFSPQPHINRVIWLYIELALARLGFSHITISELYVPIFEEQGLHREEDSRVEIGVSIWLESLSRSIFEWRLGTRGRGAFNWVLRDWTICMTLF